MSRLRNRDPIPPPLSRRERQIMDVVFRHGRATATEIHAGIPDPPSSAAVRTLLRILEQKGHLRHDKDGLRHVYYPTTPPDVAKSSALRHMIGPGHRHCLSGTGYHPPAV